MGVISQVQSASFRTGNVRERIRTSTLQRSQRCSSTIGIHGRVPELGFEPRQTHSKCVDLPVSRFWSEKGIPPINNMSMTKKRQQHHRPYRLRVYDS